MQEHLMITGLFIIGICLVTFLMILVRIAKYAKNTDDPMKTIMDYKDDIGEENFSKIQMIMGNLPMIAAGGAALLLISMLPTY